MDLIAFTLILNNKFGWESWHLPRGVKNINSSNLNYKQIHKFGI